MTTGPKVEQRPAKQDQDQGTKDMHPGTTNPVTKIEHEIAHLRAEQARLQEQIDRVRAEQALIAQAAAPPVVVVVPPDNSTDITGKSINAQIETLCREKPQTLSELVRRTHSSPSKVTAALRVLRKNLVNVSTEERPLWWWRIGDDTTTPDLMRSMAALLTVRPMLLQEVIDYTGARDNRVKGAMVRLQMLTDRPVKNLGNGRIARWFRPPTKR